MIAADVGGTSFDVSVVVDGLPQTMNQGEVIGFPVQAPWVDVRSIGAGGGSIAEIDAGGLLRVGPRSAGANPGPACYGRGGTEATVTDAAFALGMLGAGSPRRRAASSTAAAPRRRSRRWARASGWRSEAVAEGHHAGRLGPHGRRDPRDHGRARARPPRRGADGVRRCGRAVRDPARARVGDARRSSSRPSRGQLLGLGAARGRRHPDARRGRCSRRSPTRAPARPERVLA